MTKRPSFTARVHFSLLWHFLLMLVPAGFSVAAAPAPEVVIAMRYLQQSGVSHSHLYLYSIDGKLLRQLTNAGAGQDRNPIFSPSGDSIVFVRELPKHVTEWWSIGPRGDHLQRLDTAPPWYLEAKSSSHFTDVLYGPLNAAGEATLQRHFQAPDGGPEVRLAVVPGTEDSDTPDRWDVWLRPSQGSPEIRVGELPGYSAGFVAREANDPDLMLQQGDWRVILCFTHLNSTEGDTVHALDLRLHKLVRLSPNWASCYPLPGEAGILTLSEQRYTPFGDGTHTANCSYIDYWNANWRKVRYAAPGAAGICYGASLYRPGGKPPVIIVRIEPAEE